MTSLTSRQVARSEKSTNIYMYIIHIYIGSRQRSILRFVNVALNFHAITARIHYRTNSEAEGSQECFSCFLVHCAHSGPDFLGACRGGDAGLSAVKDWQRVGVSDKPAMTSSLKSSENYRSNLNQHLHEYVCVWESSCRQRDHGPGVFFGSFLCI